MLRREVEHVLELIGIRAAGSGAAGRPIFRLSSTAITLSSTYFNSEIYTLANSPVTVRVPLNLGGTGEITFGVRQSGSGTVNIVWDAGVEVAAPDGTQIAAQFVRGQITRTGPNQYTLEPGGFIQSTAGSGGGGGGLPAGTITVIPAGFESDVAASVSTGVSLDVPAGGDGNREYVAVISWDTGSTPDISSTVASSGWTKREAGYGTGNGLAVFTKFVADGAGDPSDLVLTWTGGTRTSFAWLIGVYNDAAYLDSDLSLHAPEDASVPAHLSVSVQTGGRHVIASSNNKALKVTPPSGYTERISVSDDAVAQFANASVLPVAAATASGALTVVPPAGSPGETYIAVVKFDTGDVTASIILDSSTGDWSKEATKWQTSQGTAVFWHRIAIGDVNPTVQWSGGATRGVGYVCMKVTDADATDAISATAVNANTSSDSSSPIFPAATDVGSSTRLLVSYNNTGAAVQPPQSYSQQANFSDQGAAFSKLSTGVTSAIAFVAKWESPSRGVYTTSLPLTKPTGYANGDVHILIMPLFAGLYGVAADLWSAYTVQGWTLIRTDLYIDPSVGDGVGYWYRIEDGSTFEDVTWTGNGSIYNGARILTYRNVDNADPIHAHNGQYNTASTNVTAPSITTTVDGCMIIWTGVDYVGASITGPATYTTRYNDFAEQPYDKLQTTAGATGALVGTQAGTVESLGGIIALRPAKMSNTTASMVGPNRLWHAWTIIVNPAATAVGDLGLEVADRLIATTGSTGTLVSSIASATARSNVGVSLSLAPMESSGSVPTPPPDDPPDSIVIALSPGGGSVYPVSVPAGTSYVTFAELDNIANPTVYNYYDIPVATVTASGYKYTPHAGTPVVDAVAVDVTGTNVGTWSGRITTNVVNTPGTSVDGTAIPPAATIVDNAGSTWTLVGGVAVRNGVQTISSAVVLILFKGGVVYQKNSAGGWWSWQEGSTAANPWVATVDPTGTTTGGGGGTPGTSGTQIIGLELGGNGSIFSMLKADGIGFWRTNDGGVGNISTGQSAGMVCATVAANGTNDGSIGSIVPADYASYARSTVLAYNLKRWEVLNEPYGDWFWSDSRNFSHYRQIIQATWTALQGTGCKTLMPFQIDGATGGSDGDRTWVNGLINAGCLPYADEVVVHPYGGTYTPRSVSAAGDRDQVIEAFQVSGGKKVAITEIGWPTAVNGPATGDSQQWSEAEQSANIASFCQWVRANPQMVSLMILFGSQDYGSNMWYGVLRGDGSKKPSYSVFASYAND